MWWLPIVGAALYLAVLAWISEAVERSASLTALARRPIVVGLALGVYATTWSFHGSVGFAAGHGYGFLAIHLGVTISCLAIPLLWQPLAVLVRRHRLASVADLLALRYQSQLAGVMVSAFLVIALLPYLSLQLRAIVDTGAMLSRGSAAEGIELVYAAMLCVFAAVLGVRWADVRQRGAGLLATLALESIVKMGVLLLVGAFALVRVFGGFSGLEAWLAEHPEALTQMFAPVRGQSWSALCMASFVAAFLLPRQFHVAFVLAGEGERGAAALRHTTWVLPLLLLLLNLPLPILLWAGQATPGMSTSPDMWVVELGLRHGLGLIVFAGGLSAASAMVLVSSIALSGMIVNHMVLPLAGERWLLQRLGWVRRVVIVGLVLSGFALHLLLAHSRSLVDLGLVSFAAVAQLVPGVAGALLWPRGTRRGFVAGLALGIGVWIVVAVLPLVDAAFEPLVLALVGKPSPTPAEAFAPALWLSLLINSGAYVLVSLTERQRPAEAAVAAACVRPQAVEVRGRGVQVAELRERLVAVLGAARADLELKLALEQLGLDEDERRALPLRELTRRIEVNLAEHLGPLAAADLIGSSASEPSTLAALAAELEARPPENPPWTRGPQIAGLEPIRRYLAQVLAELPVGVCAAEADGAIVVWNVALTRLTGLTPEQVLGDHLEHLPSPWGGLLSDMHGQESEAQREYTLRSGGAPRILRVRKTALEEGAAGAVLVVEDLTERRAMLAELSHRDRLRSIGRLAAGVAHEVLNPLTGILMVARNVSNELHRPTAGSDPDLPARLGTIVSEAQRIERIVRALLVYSRAQVQPAEVRPRQRIALSELVDDAVSLARLARARGESLRFEQKIDPRACVLGERQGLSQVLVNLLTNAIDASPEGATIVVSGRVSADRVIVEVCDDGSGIPMEFAERVFEPFFTTKDPGRGTGLGLATSFRIVTEHGGSLTWSSRHELEPRGCAFRVNLPMGQEQAS